MADEHPQPRRWQPRVDAPPSDLGTRRATHWSRVDQSAVTSDALTSFCIAVLRRDTVPPRSGDPPTRAGLPDRPRSGRYPRGDRGKCSSRVLASRDRQPHGGSYSATRKGCRMQVARLSVLLALGATIAAVTPSPVVACVPEWLPTARWAGRTADTIVVAKVTDGTTSPYSSRVNAPVDST